MAGGRCSRTELECKDYCNDVELNYERGLDSIRAKAAAIWHTAWEGALEDLTLQGGGGRRSGPFWASKSSTKVKFAIDLNESLKAKQDRAPGDDR